MTIEMTEEDFLNIAIALRYYPLLDESKRHRYKELYERFIDNSCLATTSDLDGAMVLINAKKLIE